MNASTVRRFGTWLVNRSYRYGYPPRVTVMDRILNRLSRAFVRAIPTCTLWKNYQEDWRSGDSTYKLGSLELSCEMVREYPKGGWTWRRLIEIMGQHP